MISAQILKTTIEQLKTFSSFYDFIFEVDKVLESLFKSSEKATKEIVTELMSMEHAKITNILTQDMNNEQAHEFLVLLVQELKNTPKFTLTLAFKPDKAFVDRLYAWVRDNVGSNYLLDFEYDAEIIGGGIFIYGGLYKDYSLKKELKKFFEEKNATQKLF